jgi:hypothetical protein
MPAETIEGNPTSSHRHLLRFLVERTPSTPSNSEILFKYRTRNGTATVEEEDFEPQQGLRQFPAGSSVDRLLIDVPVVADNNVEYPEYLWLEIYDADNAHIGRNKAKGTIRNDDGHAIAARCLNGTEGTDIAFTLEIFPPSNQVISLYYRTANNTAKSGGNLAEPEQGDFLPAEGRIEIPAGKPMPSSPIYIGTVDDKKAEQPETFYIKLSGLLVSGLPDSSGSTIYPEKSACIIFDND